MHQCKSENNPRKDSKDETMPEWPHLEWRRTSDEHETSNYGMRSAAATKYVQGMLISGAEHEWWRKSTLSGRMQLIFE
jgi:hypothetical protein